MIDSRGDNKSRIRENKILKIDIASSFDEGF